MLAGRGEAGFKVAAGELGENISTAGLDLERMPLGTPSSSDAAGS